MTIKASGVVGLTVLLFAAVSQATEIPAAEAKSHIGEHASVCGKVSSERTATNAKGSPTFINLDAAYPNQIFTILIWGEDKPNIGELPPEGSHACATG